MAIQKINIEEFLALANQFPVLDVRSPGEYLHAHIPTAVSLPLFTDDERKIVGTAYKQQSREIAIKLGLDFFGVKMRLMVEAAEGIIGNWQGATGKESKPNNNSPLPIANCLLIHCWRGGMRSAAVAWLLDLYGFKVYTLAGGYKAYRNWALQLFEQPYSLNIIGGYTGSGKTPVLQELKERGYAVLDLEALANHKGSAFGSLGENPQPSQEMFENLLALNLHNLSNPLNGIFVEDESQRIGIINVPAVFWKQMRSSKILFLEIPFEERLKYLVANYGKFEKELLAIAISRIQNRLGGLETKMAIQFLQEENYFECFRILLKYYDKWYFKGLNNRENLKTLLNKIPCDLVDPVKAVDNLMEIISFSNQPQQPVSNH